MLGAIFKSLFTAAAGAAGQALQQASAKVA